MQENTNNDEIDLFEFFKLIQKGFNKLGLLFLRLFLFVKTNAIIFIVLIITGGGLGFYLDSRTNANLKSVITLQTLYGSKDFLYESVEELNWDIQNNSEKLSRVLGLSEPELSLMSFEIKPVVGLKSITEDENQYIEFLSDQDALDKEELNQALTSNTIFHKFIIKHNGNINIKALYTKINSRYFKNNLFERIHEVSTNNKLTTMERFKSSIEQIDTILNNYSKKLLNDTQSTTSYYSSENNINLAALLKEKESLSNSINIIQVDLERQENYVFPLGRPVTSKIERDLTQKKKIIIPLLLILFFLGIKLLIFINKKSKQVK